MAEPVIEIKILGTPALLQRLMAVEGFFRSTKLRAALEDAKNAYVLLAQMDVPKDSRFLKASISGRIRNFGTPNVEILVGSSAKYAPTVEFGSKPHPIVPRRRRWLFWYEDAAGQTIRLPFGLRGVEGLNKVFRKVVSHPGTSPRPFFFRQMPIIGGRLTQALERLMNEALAGQS